VRLNKYLASCGLGSRRGCETLISEGRVLINGNTCTSLGTQVQAGDEVVCDGRKLKPLNTITLALHKPAGFVCTRSSLQNRKTVYSLIPQELRSTHYIGRLDKESEGLLIMTNNGELSQSLTHPTHKVEKEYLVTVNRSFDKRDITRMIEGIEIPEGLARALSVDLITKRKLQIVLTQGLKRQIRQMLKELGYKVDHLARVRIGRLTIGPLAPGKWRRLSDAEVKGIR